VAANGYGHRLGWVVIFEPARETDVVKRRLVAMIHDGQGGAMIIHRRLAAMMTALIVVTATTLLVGGSGNDVLDRQQFGRDPACLTRIFSFGWQPFESGREPQTMTGTR